MMLKYTITDLGEAPLGPSTLVIIHFKTTLNKNGNKIPTIKIMINMIKKFKMKI